MKRATALLPLLAMPAFTFCGAPRDTATPPSDAAASVSGYKGWCPDGFQYDSSYHMCVNGKDALGPFSASMIAKCKEFGGGPACDGERWAVAFARKIRGTRECMPGTKRDPLRYACVSGGNLYGPFSAEAVSQCRDQGGEKTCDTMRWPKTFYPLKGNPALDFSLPPPSDGDTEYAKYLWATYYYLPQVDNVADGLPLRALDGSLLGPVLARKNWCDAAMEGSVYISSGAGEGHTFNYAGTSDDYAVNCSMYFPRIDVGHSKFRLANGPYGDGVRNYILNPYRTVAVDPSVIAYGTPLYIAAARGQRVVRPDGTSFVHDGYFFAGDTGGAIKGNHIDVFIGLSNENPFPWVKSRESGTFYARILSNDTIAELLDEVHHLPPAPQPEPGPTVTPEPTAIPEPTAAPEPTVAPEPTAAPEPTVIPEPTAAPEAPTPDSPAVPAARK